ncbi:TPR end-of-group domain-containing protein [Fusibacter ferrireducens]|uniref:BCE-2095-like N-terminal domain-containing protein n=1 Tax=Fusibacter ferrireducens TaxID=2785058 RepID=A0ABR9ZM20_9FIRM|nr:hypothetical protein [Fusibacter ferrireducens]MBF4691512.1 hypothetical protein [Fusibacter ferrireducens]
MIEDKILDETLGLINGSGTIDAYNFLKSNLSKLNEISSQVYNFLYCLAATSHNEEEALEWLEEAILDKGIWYRPEVFEDEDLESIVDNERFKVCVGVSEERYNNELKTACTKFTLDSVLEENLLVVLHGNQQNNVISQSYWSNVKLDKYQIEYLQSKELDSYNLYRWDEDGSAVEQLEQNLTKVSDMFQNTILSGFSAGCNAILHFIIETDIKIKGIILNSPWIPIIESQGRLIVETLKEKKIKCLLICGNQDEDCYPLYQQFNALAEEVGYEFQEVIEDEVGHEYSRDLYKYVSGFVSQNKM